MKGNWALTKDPERRSTMFANRIPTAASHRFIRRLLLITALIGSMLAPPAARADEPCADDAVRTVFPWNETSPGDYGFRECAEILWVKAPDGADMYVEVYRPVTGADFKEEVPVILVMTPYQGTQNSRLTFDVPAPINNLSARTLLQLRNRFVPKGYAVAFGHVYGTGNSEGCLEMFGPNEIAATSAVIESLASADWSNGRVGMFGGSYDAGQAQYAAAAGSQPARRHLEAIVAVDGVVSWYEIWGHDGVPAVGAASNSVGAYTIVGQPFAPLSPGGSVGIDPQRSSERLIGACRADNAGAAAEFEQTGDFSQWLDERSIRPSAHRIRAATLMFEGLHDGRTVGAIGAVGFFDQLPDATPHKLVLGQWGHAEPALYRADTWAMVEAWFARYLTDEDTGVEDWPEVQIQASSGEWRSEKSWPSTGGPIGQLALTRVDGKGGLGTSAPQGVTPYEETSASDASPTTPGGSATFSTGPLAGPLHLVGQPVLDLWVRLDEQSADGRINVELHAFDAEGTPITSTGQADHLLVTGRLPVVGARSLQHLDAIDNGEFRQADRVAAPTGRPVHVPVRFMIATDLVVPAGGSITIEIAGTNPQGVTPSSPSGGMGTVEILHDCDTYVSALRFLMPVETPDLLDVPTKGPQTQLFELEPSLEPGLRDGGGVASAEVCGQAPFDPLFALEGISQPVETLLQFTGDAPSSGQYSDAVELSAALIDQEGNPLVGAPISFTVASEESTLTVDAITDSEGLASSAVVLEGRPGSYTLTATYVGERGHYESSSVSRSFQITREDTALQIYLTGKGSRALIEADLADLDSARGIGSATLAFHVDGQEIGSATTDATGHASISPPSHDRGGRHLYEVKFAGDDFYELSMASTAT